MNYRLDVVKWDGEMRKNKSAKFLIYSKSEIEK